MYILLHKDTSMSMFRLCQKQQDCFTSVCRISGTSGTSGTFYADKHGVSVHTGSPRALIASCRLVKGLNT